MRPSPASDSSFSSTRPPPGAEQGQPQSTERKRARFRHGDDRENWAVGHCAKASRVEHAADGAIRAVKTQTEVGARQHIRSEARGQPKVVAKRAAGGSGEAERAEHLIPRADKRALQAG